MAAFQNQRQVRSKFKPQSIKIMDQVREVLRYHHYAWRTEQAYMKWILAFIRFYDTQKRCKILCWHYSKTGHKTHSPNAYPMIK